MRRDPELIRQLMLDLESATKYVGDKHPVEGYTRDQVAYHLAMIIKAGLAEGPVHYSSDGTSAPGVPAVLLVQRLTPAGHDFIDALRDDTIWHKVKGSVATAGGSFTLELLKQLGAAYLKQALGLPPG